MIDERLEPPGDTASALACADALSLIAHDVRTSVMVIHGFSRALTEREDRMTPGERHLALDAIGRHAEVLAAFANDIMEIAQAEGGTLRFRREDLDLGSCAAAVVEQVRSDHPSRRITLDVEHAHVNAHADRRRVEQVLGNLLGNAVKYSPPDATVAVVVLRGPDYVSVTVTNEGSSLPQNLAARPFERIGADPERGGGAGMGLYLCRLIVESLGGRVWAESDAGMVTFGFLLPVAG